ncbi:MAG: restriction endonuclease, partial [Lachnospiraceae bacterium]|nr:restriction endonuclease [Lachnospiraceae bacterium]
MALNSNITLFWERPVNTKASERYVHVRFSYPDVNQEWDGWSPVEYRRTGVNISADDTEALENHLN